mgnify:CR=1 FL=1
MAVTYEKTFEIEIINELSASVYNRVLNYVLNHELNKTTLHKIYYRTYARKKVYALVAAIAPSETAVTTCRKRLERISPAANKPGVRVAMDSSVRMPPSGPRSTRGSTSSV